MYASNRLVGMAAATPWWLGKSSRHANTVGILRARRRLGQNGANGSGPSRTLTANDNDKKITPWHIETVAFGDNARIGCGIWSDTPIVGGCGRSVTRCRPFWRNKQHNNNCSSSATGRHLPKKSPLARPRCRKGVGPERDAANNVSKSGSLNYDNPSMLTS
jgi:hypothetical protein